MVFLASRWYSIAVWLHARQLDARIEVHLSKHPTHGGQFLCHRASAHGRFNRKASIALKIVRRVKNERSRIASDAF